MNEKTTEYIFLIKKSNVPKLEHLIAIDAGILDTMIENLYEKFKDD